VATVVLAFCLAALAGVHQAARRIRPAGRGQAGHAGGGDGAVGWEAGFPALGLVLIVALTYAGVRPRLDEYR
jgi:hypothetical protein